MNYNVLKLTIGNPQGAVVGTYKTKEEAEATRELLNTTTHPSQLAFFIIQPSKGE
jgi:hypothetical protein